MRAVTLLCVFTSEVLRLSCDASHARDARMRRDGSLRHAGSRTENLFCSSGRRLSFSP